MIRRKARAGALKRKETAEDKTPSSPSAWAAGIRADRFINWQKIEDALSYMRDKAIGHYIFVRPIGADTFAILLRGANRTVRYNIRPNKDYSAYIVSTLAEGKKCYHSIPALVEGCEMDIARYRDDARRDYDMIRKLEMDDTSRGARSLEGIGASDGARGQRRKVAVPLRPPSIHRSLKSRYHRSVAPWARDADVDDELHSLLGDMKLSGTLDPLVEEQEEEGKVNPVYHDYEDVRSADGNDYGTRAYYEDTYQGEEDDNLTYATIDFAATGRRRHR